MHALDDSWQCGTFEALCMVVCNITILDGASASPGEYLWLIVASWIDESSDMTISFITILKKLFGYSFKYSGTKESEPLGHGHYLLYSTA